MNSLQQSVMSGLNTASSQITQAGVYTMRTRTTDIPPTGVIITMSQSGSTTASFSSTQPSNLTSHVDMNAQFSCQSGDILTLTITSNQPGGQLLVDQPPQMIKTTIDLKQGV